MPHLSIDLLPLGCAIAGLVAVGICLVQISSKKPEVPFLSIIVVLGLGPIAINLFLPKDYTPFSGASETWIWVARGLKAVVLLLAAVQFITDPPRFGKQRRDGNILWLCVILMFTVSLLSCIFGVRLFFPSGLFLFPLVCAMLYFSSGTAGRMDGFLTATKAILCFYAYGSLAVWILYPDWALTDTLGSILPWVEKRLAGFLSHPNRLGPLMVMLVIMEWIQPSRKILRVLNVSTAVIILAGTASMTSWVMLFVVTCTLIISRMMEKWGRDAIIVSLLVGVLLIGLVAILFWDSNDESRFPMRAETESLQTLHGRVYLWNVVWDIWKKHPFFGYGPALWSEDREDKVGIVWAGQAHNQWLEALVTKGIVGLAALVIYVVVLIGYGLKYYIPSRGVSLALVLSILVMSITEVPFRCSSISSQLFLQYFTFSYFLLLEKSQMDVKKSHTIKTGRSRLGNYEYGLKEP